MAQKKRQSRVSSGKTKAIRKAQEEKRQAKFSAKREAGKAYEYKPNPFKPTKADKDNAVLGLFDEPSKYSVEKKVRWHKANDSKLPFAKMTSLMKKLDNALAKEALAAKERAEAKKSAKA